MMVHYVDPSRDAAIAGTYKDLKFKNSSEAPIYLEGYTNGSDLYFTVYGEETRPQNRKVEYQSETVSQDTPPGTDRSGGGTDRLCGDNTGHRMSDSPHSCGRS